MMQAADLVMDYNVPRSTIEANVYANSRRRLPWLKMELPHEGHAVIVGGGPSLKSCIPDLEQRANAGQVFFALNGSARWLRSKFLPVDQHVLLDARAENAEFVGAYSDNIMIASQCDRSIFDAADLAGIPVTLWHAHTDGVEDWLPDQRPPYTLIASGTTVALAAMCIAYAMGFRSIHCYGMDSSVAAEHHAYAQPLNDDDERITATVRGRTFTTTPWMAAQVDQFQRVATELADGDATITVHGDGLLPWVAHCMATPEDLSEREKYERMWSVDAYRNYAPGEHVAGTFLAMVDKGATVLDFGCGTGRGALQIANAGHQVTLLDFADNCRDDAAKALPFHVTDLTQPIQHNADVGYCTDVMEHIPPNDVSRVIENIMNAVPECFFQISTRPDSFGAAIGHDLHLTVQPHGWWRDLFESHGYAVTFEHEGEHDSQFMVKRTR